jgi:hypothetical protein
MLQSKMAAALGKPCLEHGLFENGSRVIPFAITKWRKIR